MPPQAARGRRADHRHGQHAGATGGTRTLSKSAGSRWRSFDRVVFREGPDGRGRPRGQVLTLLEKGAQQAGASPGRFESILEERDAVDRCLSLAEPGDLVVLFPTRIDAVYQQVRAFSPAPIGQPCRCMTATGRSSVHGGARSIPPEDRPLFERGCLEAVSVAAAILSQGGSALDAAEMAVRLLEDLPHFNAGRGSVTNADGNIEMDAAIMDGETLALGGVGAIRDVRHPIRVARALLSRQPILLTGEGACNFASEIGAEQAPPLDEDLRAKADEGVRHGRLRGARHGRAPRGGRIDGRHCRQAARRIGDTPLPGCGLYADDAQGAVACSGDGESIARVLLAAHAVHALAGRLSDAGRPQRHRPHAPCRRRGRRHRHRFPPDGWASRTIARNFHWALPPAGWLPPHAATDAADLEGMA